MPTPTPGYIKNMIRRSFRELVEPSPRKKDEERIWEFFNYECAYCGKKLDRNGREGRIDHLISSSSGGTNHISNRVLSCASCNDEEKLDMDWQKFLKAKIPDKSIAEKRKLKIIEWQRQNKFYPANELLMKAIESTGEVVVAFYDAKIKYIRELKSKNL